jgi:hypothetical protein
MRYPQPTFLTGREKNILTTKVITLVNTGVWEKGALVYIAIPVPLGGSREKMRRLRSSGVFRP